MDTSYLGLVKIADWHWHWHTVVQRRRVGFLIFCNRRRVATTTDSVIALSQEASESLVLPKISTKLMLIRSLNASVYSEMYRAQELKDVKSPPVHPCVAISNLSAISTGVFPFRLIPFCLILGLGLGLGLGVGLGLRHALRCDALRTSVSTNFVHIRWNGNRRNGAKPFDHRIIMQCTVCGTVYI